MNFKFDLGILVKCKITNFEGIITARSEHLNGCNRYWVQPRIKKDGKYPDGYWMDEESLIVIKEKKIKNKKNENGGFPSAIK